MNLYPNSYFNKVEEITIDFLKEKKLKAMILDVDNTLIDYEKRLMPEKINWTQKMKEQGIKLYILSNTNHKEKVEKVAQTLQIPYEYFAKKPCKKGFIKVQNTLKEKPESIAVVGDQIFTDILGGNRCHMYTILVEPVAKKDFWFTAWKRPIENKIKKIYQMKQTKEKENVY